jgi:hypothetical protein
MIPPLVGLIPGTIANHVHGYFPTIAGQLIGQMRALEDIVTDVAEDNFEHCARSVGKSAGLPRLG